MKVDISPFAMDSYDDVLALWHQCEGVGLSDADSRESIQAYLERNSGMSFVALSDGKVMGAVLCGHDGRRGYLHHLAVAPSCRRRGVGRQLVDHCTAALADAGIRKCHIFTFESNADGISFWSAAGWIPRSDIGVMSKLIGPAPGHTLPSTPHRVP